MSQVYRALDRLTGQTVAFKVLRGEGSRRARRFLHEAQVLADLHHPGVVGYIAHGITPSRERYLVMEWLEGYDLARRLKRGPLSADDSLALVERLADALAAAHARGIVHRDIKPSNVFLVGGDIDHVKLLDFGVARLRFRGTDATRAGRRIGTPRYMAPEQVRGATDIDARADVFALGCVLFACLTGKPAFPGRDAMAVMVKILLEDPPRVGVHAAGVPQAVEDLVARMLEKDRARRPDSAARVAADLAAIRAQVRSQPAVTGKPESLTLGETRVLSVVLVAGGPNDSDGHRDDLRAIVDHHGGRVESLADGTVVVTLKTGAVVTDQAALAARCALALRGLFADASMAIATGRGVLAESVPLGKVIERAVALVQEAAGTIRIDDESASLLDDRFRVVGARGAFSLAGTTEPEAPIRSLLGRERRCVGRERELTMLSVIYEECVMDGVARAVLITGPPGVGKSRLGNEFLHRLDQRGDDTEVWVAAGDPMRAGSAFGLITPLIEQAAQAGDSLREAALHARISRHVAAAEVDRVCAFLGELCGIPIADNNQPELSAARRDPVIRGDQIRRAWGDWLAAETRDHPLVIVLEDLHWGDLPTVTLIDGALSALAEHPLMVVALARPEVTEQFPHLWEGRPLTSLRLAGLSRRASQILVSEAMGERASPEVIERVVDRAGGNAFYLEELCRKVAGGEDALPESVLATVQARLESFPAKARRMVRAASAYGQRFWVGGVRALLGVKTTAADIEEWLRALDSAEVIARCHPSRFAGEIEYRFRHELFREAAYAALTDRDRQVAHRLAAGWLEAAGERDALALAEHFERGGEARRAVSLISRAAEQALEGDDFASAAALARRAVAAGAEGDQLGAANLVIAEAEKWRGDNDAAAAAGRCAMAAVGSGSAAWWRAAGEVASGLSKLARAAKLAAVGEEMLAAEVAAGADGEHIAAASRAAVGLYLLGRHRLGAALMERVRSAGDGAAIAPEVCARIHNARAVEALVSGDAAAYLTACEDVIAELERAGDARNACGPRVNMGFAYGELGLYDRAEDALREALLIGERLGLAYVVGGAKQNLGAILARRGRLAEALAVESEAVASFSGQGERFEGRSRVHLSWIHARAGRLEAAAREAELAMARLSSAPPLVNLARAVRADVALAQGEIPRAIALAEAAHDGVESLGRVDVGDAYIHVVCVRARVAAGDGEGARTLIAHAKDRLLARAALITDPDLRETFLTAVAENAETLTLATTLLP